MKSDADLAANIVDVSVDQPTVPDAISGMRDRHCIIAGDHPISAIPPEA
jgi:hypothetical protein